jgi:hypothetical protein
MTLSISHLLNVWMLIRFLRTESTDRLYVNRKDDQTIVKRYSLVLLETLFMKKRKLRNDIYEVLKIKKEEITNERHRHMKDHSRLSRKRIFSNVGSGGKSSHATLSFTKECKHIWEHPWASYFNTMSYLFCLYICVWCIYLHFSVSSSFVTETRVTLIISYCRYL